LPKPSTVSTNSCVTRGSAGVRSVWIATVSRGNTKKTPCRAPALVASRSTSKFCSVDANGRSATAGPTTAASSAQTSWCSIWPRSARMASRSSWMDMPDGMIVSGRSIALGIDVEYSLASSLSSVVLSSQAPVWNQVFVRVGGWNSLVVGPSVNASASTCST
jgi:hypothetical protein